MISTDAILKEWEQDCQLEYMEYDMESLKTPKLHSKYLRYLYDYKRAEKATKRQIETAKRDMLLFYTGKAEAKDYKDSPLQTKVLKTDVPVFVAADKQMQELENMSDTLKFGIYVLEQILQEIKGRQWVIRNAIEWRKFKDGS